MNMKLVKNIIFLSLFLNFLISGTVYITKSLDPSSSFSVKSKGVTPVIKLSGSGNDFGGFFSETYSLGYFQSVWKKKKIKYNVNLGFEYMQNDNFNFLSVYTMLNYGPSQQFTISFLVGLNFYNHENDYFNIQEYYPDSKGGHMYGLSLIYNTNNKFPIALDYKVYTFSEVQSDIWYDFEYLRCAISLGYKF